MPRLLWIAWIATCLVRFCSSTLVASDEESSEKQTVVQPTLGPLQKTISIDGVFAANTTTEIAIHLKSETTLRVLDVVRHGAMVKQGEVLLRFDPTDLKEKFEEKELALALLKVQLEEAEIENQLAEIHSTLEREQAELTKVKADQDFQFFMEHEHPLSQKAADELLKATQDNHGYVAEELRQLEKMYKADDLTEESEEIVLKRAKDSLDRSQFDLEQARVGHQRSKDLEVPRSKQEAMLAHRLAEITYERFRRTHSLARQKQSVALKKQRLEWEQSQRELHDLQSDLASMTIAAAHAGTVYYGEATDGKWESIGSMKAKLRPHTTVQPHEVLMTIVPAGELSVLAAVRETHVAQVLPGMKGTVRPTSISKHSLDATIRSVETIPNEDGEYPISVLLNEPSKSLFAGMTCTLKFVTYFQPKALSLPARFVTTDPNDDSIHHVHLSDGNGGTKTRRVELGVRVGDRVEILSGLTPNDSVVSEKSASTETE